MRTKMTEQSKTEYIRWSQFIFHKTHPMLVSYPWKQDVVKSYLEKCKEQDKNVKLM